MTTIRVILFPVGEPPRVVEVENDFRAMQALVDGPLQFVPLDDGQHLYCNENGGGAPNAAVVTSRGPIPIDGPFFVSRLDADADDVGVTDDDIRRAGLGDSQTNGLSG